MSRLPWNRQFMYISRDRYKPGVPFVIYLGCHIYIYIWRIGESKRI
jgi:hypothetical protein